MRHRRNQLCPIHRSLSCCGRETIPKEKRQRQMGIRRIEDPHHPRGYRELRSNGEMRKLLDRKIAEQNGLCALCKERFTEYGDMVPDHIHPRGMGGAWRDDHPDNIQAVHWWCNGERDRAEVDFWPCAIFLSLHGRIDPETRKRDPHHVGTKKLPSAYLGTYQIFRRTV